MTSRLALVAAAILALACLGSTAQTHMTQSSHEAAQMESDEHNFGNPLDAEERAIVAALSPAQVKAIDAALIVDVPMRWEKVAMVLANQLSSRPGIPDNIPLEYYWQRLRHFVDIGKLELQGDMRRARFSEIRRH